MLTDKEFHNLINEISYEIDFLEGKIKVLKSEQLLNKIGFPKNWRDILNIN